VQIQSAIFFEVFSSRGPSAPIAELLPAAQTSGLEEKTPTTPTPPGVPWNAPRVRFL
jgi:hypothetical protein